MSRDPYQSDNFERQRSLQHEEESFQLRQEERRLELARRRATLGWITNSIYLLVGLLEILLVLRFFLRLAGANTQNTFAQFIYNLSEPFIAPFSTLFVSPVTAGGASIFDINVLIAMIVYALLGWLAVWLFKFVQGR
ncbi:YggT family protein [Pantanalinema sp. GBBB05]|uniref:YggT family protein n=1 Tax=Pantanalinema sp. GBBB05 TaxID=2604139 RepID=UPI001DD7589A|nr:YggT family protein [Pantanalinema sp. GBBB05]